MDEEGYWSDLRPRLRTLLQALAALGRRPPLDPEWLVARIAEALSRDDLPDASRILAEAEGTLREWTARGSAAPPKARARRTRRAEPTGAPDGQGVARRSSVARAPRA